VYVAVCCSYMCCSVRCVADTVELLGLDDQSVTVCVAVGVAAVCVAVHVALLTRSSY